MSLWIRRRDAEGNIHHYAIPFDPLALMACLCVVMGLLLSGDAMFRGLAVHHPLEAALAIAATIAFGLAMLTTAKWSLFRNGTLVSFGSSRMACAIRRLYFAGYALIVIGALLTFLFLRSV